MASDLIVFFDRGGRVIFCLTHQDSLNILVHMRTRAPLQEKTPFAIDAKPMEGLLTAQAGLAAFSRAFRSLDAPRLCDEHVRVKQRERGFTAGQRVESLVLLHTAGGDCMQDIEQLRKAGGGLLIWQRAKAGTIEHVHDEIKNGLGGGQLPSAKFGANAAWFRIACIAYNILVAVRQAWPDETLHNAKAKRVRFVLINVTGRFSRDRRKITLHLSATVEWIKRLARLFARFPLATQPTG